MPFLEEFGVGLEFLGEQGAESIHARFNAIKKNYSNMPNSVQRLECMMTEHFRQTCPQNLSKLPEPKQYNQEDEAVYLDIYMHLPYTLIKTTFQKIVSEKIWISP